MILTVRSIRPWRRKIDFVKKYEGLFILNTAGKEEGVKEMIDRITAEINSAGGRVETVQKMDKRSFTRVANKRFNSGYYVNFIFELEPSTLAQLKHRFDLNDEVFRVLFTIAPPPKPAAAATAAA
jgi:small subunit ribosomal protein S6